MTTNLTPDMLVGMNKEALFSMGFRIWDKTEDGTKELWLYPQSWYARLADGTKVIDIFFEEESFEFGITDNDTRCGMLAFGFLRPVDA